MSPAQAGPRLRQLSDIAWRLGVVAAALFVVGALIWHLRLVTIPIFIAVMICTALAPPVNALEKRGVRTLAATWIVFGGALVVLGGVFTLIIPPTIEEFSDVGAAVSDGLRDVEDWLVEGPLDLDRDEVQRWTRDPVGRVEDIAGESSDAILAGARTAGEVAIGAVLALVLTFLFLKDGRRIQRTVLGRMRPHRRDVVRACANRIWQALGGFLRGAAILGVVEGIIIATTMTIVGAPLAIPVAVLTLFGAFFPIVGAVVAGAIAVLVTLAAVGPVPALVVLIVAVIVQQLDNDLLAPFIYGQSLSLHPAAILVALTAGGALAGAAGAFLAVPLVSAVWGVTAELWDRRDDLMPLTTQQPREPEASAAPEDP